MNTLSDTAWGALFVMMCTTMGSAIVYLMLYVRSLNRKIEDLGEKRTQDAKDDAAEAQKLVRESLEAVNKATRAIEELSRKVGEWHSTTMDELANLRRRLPGGD